MFYLIYIDWHHLPTSAKRTQYNATNIGNGIDAKWSPNFPKCK